MNGYENRSVFKGTLTKEQHDAIAETLSHPVSWRPKHRHSSLEAMLIQKREGGDGINPVPSYPSTQ